MSGNRPVIVWFRRDLRLEDNPALAAAGERPLIALYVLDQSEAVRPLGRAAQWWLNRSLRALAARLATFGGALTLRRGVAETVVEDLARGSGASAVYWNRLYDPGSTGRDAKLKARLGLLGVECRSFYAALLN